MYLDALHDSLLLEDHARTRWAALPDLLGVTKEHVTATSCSIFTRLGDWPHVGVGSSIIWAILLC